MEVHIQRVQSLAGCEQARDIARELWGDEAACSVAQMSVHAQYGGVVLVAEVDGQAVGFLVSFPARYKGEFVLWSHEAGVLEPYLHKGIGYRLKDLQRKLALAEGYASIVWTYDPLIARNAHFNLNKLGAAICEFKVNAYGADETDLINRGLETDRFVVRWNLKGAAISHSNISDVTPILQLEDGVPKLRTVSAAGTATHFAVDIPLDFSRLMASQRESVQAWKMAFRQATLSLEQAGYAVD
jgi:predicted GNAT superfamily acetyltransferase